MTALTDAELRAMSDAELCDLTAAVERERERRRKDWSLTEEERAMSVLERTKSLRWRLNVDLKTAVEIARRG